MPRSTSEPVDPARPRLGPQTVGRRVVVRRILHRRTGPSGGPTMSDVLGVMESWDGTTTAVRTATGELVVIEVADIVAGKPIPPPPPRRGPDPR